MNLQKLKIQARLFLADAKLFGRVLWGYLFELGYGVFFHFEKVKKKGAKVLYWQRGRFSAPFIHASMGAVIALGVTLAPVLANSLSSSVNEQTYVEPQDLTSLNLDEADMTTQISDKVRDSVIGYIVQNGDTLSNIAERYGVSANTIRWENKLSAISAIKPGQTLKILPVTGVMHKVVRGDTIYSISKKYKANPQAIVDYPFNDFVDNETFALAVGQTLMVPDGVMPSETTVGGSTNIALQKTPNAGDVSATGRFAWPIAGVITQRYGWYHTGIDIATTFGTQIVAADSGTVLVASWPDNSGYGLRVVIDHGNGYNTWYGHMSKVSVVPGQTVRRGDVIGFEGSTGRSTGPHLHFEIRRGKTRLNPLDFLK